MIEDKLEIVSEILQWKSRRNAVILVHNYQRLEVQEISDYIGDSLELSRVAAETDADVIVFCGVHFMAETACIVNPDKTVILPDMDSGCPMADMITAEDVIEKKKELPEVTTVCYINSSAAVKAESDICCTSGNALQIVKSLGDEDIFFVPDQYLGEWVSKTLGRPMHLWHGFCPTHMKILPEDILARKKQHPGAKVLVHPECRSDTWEIADEVLSTGGMVRYVESSPDKEFIIGTEIGIITRLQKENPGKTFIAATDKAVCPNMKRITLEKVLRSLQDMQNIVTVPEDIRIRALSTVERMLAVK